MPQALALVSLASPSPPTRLGDQILASRATLAGERKSVTVLVVDLKGLSDIAHTVDPEVQHHLFNGAIQLTLREIHGVEGFVTQFTEQGLVALFGAPLAVEDHALRVLHAALGIQRAVPPTSPMSNRPRQSDALPTAEPLAAALHDRRRLAGIAASMTFFYRAMGDHERAVAYGQQALTLSDMLQDMALQTETCLYLGTAYHGLGRDQQALAAFAQACATLARHPQQAFVGEVGILDVPLL